jgi:hypothetical protein
LSARAHQALAGAGLLALLTGCASTVPSRTFPPAGPDDARRTIAAWTAVRERAASLPASRLLYDAKLGTGGAPSVPGTLAVVYDGQAVVTASLTGPFGSRIAEYRDGTVTGEDRRALVVDPEALRAVLAGTWNDDAPVVRGYADGQGLLAMESEEARVTAVVDVSAERVVSMDLSGRAGRLAVDYPGEPRPWPEKLSIRDETKKKSLALKLLAVEPAGAARTSGP